MTIGSLFAGIGGFDLGLERAGFTIRWQVEIDPYCQRVLAKHWPTVTRYGDIRSVDWGAVEPVALLCGGFPCQDVSHAGPRTGIEGARSGLWTEFRRAIAELRPSIVLVENVTGLFHRGFDVVLSDLSALRYDAEWSCLSACAVGAPHTRERVFIVAYPASQRPGQLRGLECSEGRQEKRNVHWAQHEPGCERVAHGIPARVDRLRGLGNAIVPQIAEWIGRRILMSEYDGRWDDGSDSARQQPRCPPEQECERCGIDHAPGWCQEESNETPS